MGITSHDILSLYFMPIKKVIKARLETVNLPFRLSKANLYSVGCHSTVILSFYIASSEMMVS